MAAPAKCAKCRPRISLKKLNCHFSANFFNHKDAQKIISIFFTFLIYLFLTG